MKDSERERFEKWVNDVGVPYHFARSSDGSYCSVIAHWVWQAWKTAASLERERCAKIADEEKIIVPLDGEDEHYNLACDRVAAAIRRGEGDNGASS